MAPVVQTSSAEIISSRSSSPVIAATVTATAASPETLVVVRIMSMIRSTPATKAMVSSGTPTLPKTSAIMIRPAPGMPAAPIAPSVEVIEISR